MRRHDREMPEAFALAVCDKCQYAVLSMVDPSGQSYCIPITIARFEDEIYFHCAHSGFKIACLRSDNRVCLACVGDTKPASDKFTTEYESAIIRGTASQVMGEEEKIMALRLICQRHTPANMNNFDEAIKRSLSRTSVWKIKIAEISGKRKKYDAQGKEMKFCREQ